MHSPKNHVLQKNNHEILIISYLELQLSQMMPLSHVQPLAKKLHEEHSKRHCSLGRQNGSRDSAESCGQPKPDHPLPTASAPHLPAPCATVDNQGDAAKTCSQGSVQREAQDCSMHQAQLPSPAGNNHSTGAGGEHRNLSAPGFVHGTAGRSSWKLHVSLEAVHSGLSLSAP